MRIRGFVLALAWWWGASCATAQPQTTLPTEGVAPSLAYAVVDPSGVEHYLMGTLHARPADQAQLSAWHQALLERAAVLVLEVDPSEMNTSSEQQLWLRWALLNARVLDELLDAELRSLLKQRLRQIGLSAEQVQVFQPWAVEVLIATVRAFLLGLRPEAGVDRVLHQHALARGTPILSLEDRSSQWQALASAPWEDQLHSLRRTLKDGWEEAEATLHALVDLYGRGDARGLSALLERIQREDPSLHARLVVKRNRAMADRLVELAREGRPLLVAVGAAHLFGEQGLPNLLRQRGWRVRPLPTAD